jgi:hypothetical protein
MRRTIWLLAWVLKSTIAFAANPQTWSFSNHSSNELVVARVLCDGRAFGIPVGILIPGGAKSTADMFPKKLPGVFTIEFHKDSQSLTQSIDGKQVSDLLKMPPPGSDIVLHFVFSHRHEFVPKVEARSPSLRSEESKLWPDENLPSFQAYKTLVRAAHDGNVARVRTALKGGAPFSWPDNPVGSTPLEWTVRWNHESAFDELMKVLPPDYSPYAYGHCIMLALDDGHLRTLGKLLAQPIANAMPPRLLQEIFYTACYSTDTAAPLEMLLQHYQVGIDYRVRDYGHTLLFVAVQGRKHAVVEWLVKHGANKTSPLQNGSKPMDWARDERMRWLLAQP